MSRYAGQTISSRSRMNRKHRPIGWYPLGGTAFAGLYLVAYGLWPQTVPGRATSATRAGQSVPDREVPVLLAQARNHNPLLRLPHAHWFIRIRHGHAQIVAVDHAPLRSKASATGARGGH